MPLLQELIRVAYEHSLIRYLLLTRDKIVQVNPEQHLLTESGMQSLRTAGMYREESMQARANYAVIAENFLPVYAAKQTGNVGGKNSSFPTFPGDEE
jgi:hypothetical protein